MMPNYIEPLPQISLSPQQVAVDGGYVAHWCREAEWGSDLIAPFCSRMVHIASILRSSYPLAHIFWAWDCLPWLEEDGRLERIRLILNSLGITSYASQDECAHNFIASCGICAPGLIVSGDKFLHSIVEPDLPAISYEKTGWVLHDVDWIQRKWGVPPHLLADYLAWVGDPAFGISGIPNVTPASALEITLRIGKPLTEVDFNQPEYRDFKTISGVLLDNRFAIAPCASSPVSWVPKQALPEKSIKDIAQRNGVDPRVIL